MFLFCKQSIVGNIINFNLVFQAPELAVQELTRCVKVIVI